ncbi:spore germination protein KC [Desulfohalotomaculum tongense]|uniref:Ger(x)C family spore germination protein n=1 Tax=Desulforadius tongensis TaxID=1216062 RepID=UPI00195DBA2C|nr:Ger(x)C family spore germination protein [Desulforadius tongensis]MBM7855093.1 spore germination protein KC [Desulforadius tongensis]
MRKAKVMLLTFMLLVNMLIPAGCWNYKEVEDLAIAAGLAVDKDPKDGKYLLTVEIIKPQAQEKEMQIKSTTVKMKGDTIFSAIRNFIALTGKKLYWSHAKVIIVSKEIAQENIVPIIDWINRDAEVRPDMFLIISREKTAGEILESSVEIESIVSFQLEDMLKNKKSLSTYPSFELWEFINDLSAKGISAAAATVNTVTVKGKTKPQMHGTAIFKKDTQVGWFNGSETRGLLWLRNEMKGGALIEELANIKGKQTKITLEIFDAKTKIKPVYKDDRLVMNVNINMEAAIAEIDAAGADLLDKKVESEIKQAVVEEMKRRLQNAIKKAQSYQSDVFGFGQLIQREMPSLWKQMEPNWDEIFPQLDTDININIDIRSSALTSRSIKVGD